MGADRIEGLDVYGYSWEAMRGNGPSGSVAWVQSEGESAVLSRADAARLGLFMLEAAGVDLVGAARRVRETGDALLDASAQDRASQSPSTLIAVDAAESAHEEAQEALSAELAKLEGGT